MRQRAAPPRPSASRAFVDQALADLRLARWRAPAWASFLWRCGVRSAEQARAHPRAALEVTGLHLGMLPVARGARLRVAVSWAMAITHLGLLGSEERSLGPASALSLLRANLSAGRWAPLVAIATDVADGWLARRTTPTAYGAFADALADVAFWSRQAWARERNPALRSAGVAAWLLPAAAIAGAYLVRGGTVDYPRPLVVRRLSAGLQCLLALRALRDR